MVANFGFGYQQAVTFGYEQIKVLLFLLLITFSGFLWALSKPKLKLTSISKVGLGFIAILGLTSFLGLNPVLSFLGTEPYYQGWILYCYLFLFFLMVIGVNIEFKNWAISLSISSFLVSFFAFKDWVLLNIFHISISTYAGRVVSTFGQPNFYGGFVLLTLPFTYYLLSKTSSRKMIYLIYFVLFIELFAIVVSESRIAWLMACAYLFLLLVNKLTKFKRLIFSGLLIVIILAVVYSVYYSSGIYWQEWTKPNDSEWIFHNSPEKRIYIWPVVVKLIKDNFLIGYGLENINLALSKYFTDNKHTLFEENLNVEPVLLSLRDLNVDRSHNYILDLLMFSGIFGVLSYLLLIFFCLKKILISPIKLETTTLLLGLLIYLIWIQFQNQSIVHLIYFWLLVGFIDRLDK